MKTSTLKQTAGWFLGTIAIASLTTSCNHTMPPQTTAPNAATTPAMAPMDHSQMGGMNHSAMDSGPADADYDLRFIDGMTPHHDGAIVMAQAVMQQSQRPELKKLAEGVIRSQTQETTKMQQWRSTWYPKAAATPMAWHSEMKHMMPMSEPQIKSMRMDMDLGKADANFDRRFLDAMIPHHEGAIVMAQDALKKTKRPEVQKLAKEIIAAQQVEIDQMKQWRKDWYGK
jgi:uncharacterized protein (DUF305 family)